MRKADGRLTSCRRSRTSHERRRAQQSARDCAQNLVQKQQRKILELQEELARFSAQPLIDQLEDRLNCIRAELQYLDLPEHPPPEVKLRRNVAAHSKSELLDGKKVSELSLRQLRSVQKGLAVGPADADFGHNDECDSPHHYASCDIEEDTGLITDFAEQYSTSPLDFFTGFAEEHGWPFYSLTVGTIWAFCYWVVYYTLLLYIILSCFNVGNFFVLCYWVLLLGVYLTNTYSMASTHGRGSAFDELIEDSDSYTVQDHGHLDECVSPHRCANNESEEDIGRHVFTDSAEENLETERLGKEKNGNFVVTLRPACLNLTLHDEEVKDGALEDNPGSLHDLHGYALHDKKDMDESVHERLGKEKNGNFVVTLRPARWKNLETEKNVHERLGKEKNGNFVVTLRPACLKTLETENDDDILHENDAELHGKVEKHKGLHEIIAPPRLGRWRNGKNQRRQTREHNYLATGPSPYNFFYSSRIDGNGGIVKGMSEELHDMNSLEDLPSCYPQDNALVSQHDECARKLVDYQKDVKRWADSDEKPGDKENLKRWADVFDSGNEEETEDDEIFEVAVMTEKTDNFAEEVGKNGTDDDKNMKIPSDDVVPSIIALGPTFCCGATARIMDRVISSLDKDRSEKSDGPSFPCHFDMTLFDSPGGSIDNHPIVPTSPPGVFDFTTKKGFGMRNLLEHDASHDLEDGAKQEQQGFIYLMASSSHDHFMECISVSTVQLLAKVAVARATDIAAKKFYWMQCSGRWRELYHKTKKSCDHWRHVNEELRAAHRAKDDELRNLHSSGQAIIDSWKIRCDNLVDNTVANLQYLFQLFGISRTEDELFEHDLDTIFGDIGDKCVELLRKVEDNDDSQTKYIAKCDEFESMRKALICRAGGLHTANEELQIKIFNLQALNSRLVHDLQHIKKDALANASQDILENELQTCLDCDEKPRQPSSSQAHIDEPFECLRPDETYAANDLASSHDFMSLNKSKVDSDINGYFDALRSSILVKGFTHEWHLMTNSSCLDSEREAMAASKLQNESETPQISRISGNSRTSGPPRRARRSGKGKKNKRGKSCDDDKTCEPNGPPHCEPNGPPHPYNTPETCGPSGPTFYAVPCEPVGPPHYAGSCEPIGPPHYAKLETCEPYGPTQSPHKNQERRKGMEDPRCAESPSCAHTCGCAEPGSRALHSYVGPSGPNCGCSDAPHATPGCAEDPSSAPLPGHPGPTTVSEHCTCAGNSAAFSAAQQPLNI